MNELQLCAVSHSHALPVLLVLGQKLCELCSFLNALPRPISELSKALLSHYAQVSQLFSWSSHPHTHFPQTTLTKTFPGRDTNIFISQPSTFPVVWTNRLWAVHKERLPARWSPSWTRYTNLLNRICADCHTSLSIYTSPPRAQLTPPNYSPLSALCLHPATGEAGSFLTPRLSVQGAQNPQQEMSGRRCAGDAREMRGAPPGRCPPARCWSGPGAPSSGPVGACLSSFKSWRLRASTADGG